MAEQGKRPQWRTSIAHPFDGGRRIIVRGYDLLKLTGRIDFATAVFLIYNSELPAPNQAKMLNAILVCSIDHGIAPSETVTRFIAASGVPIQGAIAGGLLTFGDIHGGAGQEYAELIQGAVKRAKAEGLSLPEMARRLVEEHRSARKRFPGYGHPQHPEGDPRGPVLLGLADHWGISSDHITLARAIEDAIAERAGRRIPINIDGLMGSILSDLGFDYRAARSIIMLSRTAGLGAHAIEEMVREPGWRAIPLDEVVYDGIPDRPIPAEILNKEL